jgi:formate-dependent nitrite reductase membrane component NrfD
MAGWPDRLRPDALRARLDELVARRLGLEPPDRHAAEREAAGAVAGQRVVAVGYYGLPVLKRAHWRSSIALYFFLSGLAAGAYLLAALADLFGGEEDEAVASTGRWLALIALLPCPLLLIEDLERPGRFLNMLRIVKPRSPMSAGSWMLTLFGGVAGGSVLLEILGAPRRLRRALALAGAPVAAFIGSYTGVLLAATAVPLWGRARAFLSPIFFLSGCSAALAAVALALRLGRRGRPASEQRLRELETLVLAGELTLVSAALRHLGPLARPLVARPCGPLFWGGSVLAGQVAPLLLGRLERAAPLANLLVLLGSLATRWAVVRAGQASSDDPQAAFAYHR